MMLSRASEYAGKGFQVFFPLFLFFSAIFCGYTRVNNLFHLSALCLLVMLAGNAVLRRQLFSDRRFNIGLSLTTLMLGYFCLTTLWSPHPQTLISDLTHALYLLLFLLMFRLMTLQGRRSIALWAVASGGMVLVVLTFLTVDPKTMLSHRMTDGFFGAPPNVIDLAGYFALGIFMCLILIRDTGARWLYLPVTVLLIALLLTQSRGPLLSLLCALVVLSALRSTMRGRHLLAMALIGAGVPTLLFMTRFGDIFLQRIVSGYQQSFIRFGIWRHTLELVAQKPFFGWGLDKQLSFVNLLGDTITTTHSLYMAALLKGGACGMLLLALVLVYGFIMAKQQCDRRQGLEGALFLFATEFYLTQGMFIIGNPAVAWNMFWFPLAVVLTLPAAASHADAPDCPRQR
ncbi:putative lipid A core:surface polymer ligase [Sodalis glossinidius str. 'morsitans']|uniref:Lipid A core:surface polymer ligase n=2 Tax=Sodalis glossinidius (strain morsitans) TaxID=343509 RepID=Q2NQV2_SODGM|nr:O-antigen ligase family protein [Sodalis glossinidius]BAE75473.1 putative lipid A core:surface polymer ligase [Sodalis glossinidius str. 'morsitans']